MAYHITLITFLLNTLQWPTRHDVSDCVRPCRLLIMLESSVNHLADILSSYDVIRTDNVPKFFGIEQPL